MHLIIGAWGLIGARQVSKKIWKFPDTNTEGPKRQSGKFPNGLESFQMAWKVSRCSGKFLCFKTVFCQYGLTSNVQNPQRPKSHNVQNQTLWVSTPEVRTPNPDPQRLNPQSLSVQIGTAWIGGIGIHYLTGDELNGGQPGKECIRREEKSGRRGSKGRDRRMQDFFAGW